MMPIIATAPKEKEFPKIALPDAGTVQAVCCGVWDLGIQKTSFNNEEKLQHKIIVAWEIQQKIDNPESEYHGKPYILNKKYTLSLGEKANLRQDLESWRGTPFTSEEIHNGFDVEKLYGVNCYIGIKHEPDKKDPSRIYANVSAILPLPKGVEKIAPDRKKDDAPPAWVVKMQENAVKPFGENPF